MNRHQKNLSSCPKLLDHYKVTQELSRLSKENSELRQALDAAIGTVVTNRQAEHLSVLETLKAIPKTIGIREKGKSTWDHKASTTLYVIFTSLAPELLVEKSIEAAAYFLGLMNKPAKVELSPTFPVASNTVKALFADLHSLGLVEPSKKKHPITDKNDYWCLTEDGGNILKLDRMKKLELVAASAASHKS